MSEEILKIMADLADDLETVALNIKQKIAKITRTKESVAVKEEAFTCLKFEIQQGAKLGDYEVAYKEQNLPEHWNHAYNILKVNNATISNRYMVAATDTAIGFTAMEESTAKNWRLTNSSSMRGSIKHG